MKGPYAEPLYFPDKPPDSVPLYNSCCEEKAASKYSTVTTAKKTKKPSDDNEEKAASKHCPVVHPIMLMSEPENKKNDLSVVPKLELHKLERGEASHNVLPSSFFSYFHPTDCSLCTFADFYLNSLSQLHSAEMQEQLLSCLSSEPYSNWEPWDKKVWEILMGTTCSKAA